MIVIADCSPLNYLILIEEVEVLPRLFGRVLIPHAVAGELRSLRAPSKVADWMAVPPPWLQLIQTLPLQIGQLGKLDEGEREAISLALEQGPGALLLIDESKGRAEAARLHIKVMGLVGILDRASAMDLIDLPAAIQRLQQTSFFIAPRFLRVLLEADSERRRMR